jgi:hypothetical protein
MTQQDFNAINEVKKTEYLELQNYNPEIWKQYNILEPLEDMKTFSVED